MFMRFEGKTALVTGGSRGIGRACVVRLAREGARVAFVYQQSQQAAEQLMAELAGGASEVCGLQADVRDGEQAQEVVNRLLERWQRLDVLVNSAGVVSDGLFGSMTEEQWRTVIEVNLGGTYHYSRAVVQAMLMERRGSIVNLSSTAAEFAARGQVNYAASKGGIDGFTRALAKELAPRNVRVNAVAPGMIETDMSQVVRGVAGDQLNKLIPLRRIGKPEEVAAVVAFLASDDASYITGQVIRADGGLSLGGY
jgi:3-oxoacyl-[acyl-carrier protein] reductase